MPMDAAVIVEVAAARAFMYIANTYGECCVDGT
jgi:hypothetical protein